MQAWIHAGFDNYLCTPNGMTHRLLTRLAKMCIRDSIECAPTV